MVRLPKWFVVVLALAVLVGWTATAVLATESTGKIKSVSPDKKEFVFTDKDGKDWTFHLADDAKLRAGTQNLKLNDLKVGDQATVTWEKKGDKMIAKEVRCEKK